MWHRRYKPVDCTTNPSLVLKAVQNPQYHHYLKEAMASEPDHRDSENSDRYLLGVLCIPAAASARLQLHLRLAPLPCIELSWTHFALRLNKTALIMVYASQALGRCH